MALIVLECPICHGTQWSMVNYNLNQYLCTGCNEWINEIDLDLCIVDTKLEEDN
jgi:hypothetical protein